MFHTALAIAEQYTQPVIISRRAVNGKCSSSIGSYVVINAEGWIVTAGHIIEQIAKLNDETLAARDREQRETSIRRLRRLVTSALTEYPKRLKMARKVIIHKRG
jgi:hypothetical protein